MPEGAVTAFEVFTELAQFKEKYAGERAQLLARIEALEQANTRLAAQTAQALQLLSAIQALDPTEVTRIRGMLQRQSSEESAQRDFDRQMKLTIVTIVLTGLFGALLWPLLQKSLGL